METAGTCGSTILANHLIAAKKSHDESRFRQRDRRLSDILRNEAKKGADGVSIRIRGWHSYDNNEKCQCYKFLKKLEPFGVEQGLTFIWFKWKRTWWDKLTAKVVPVPHPAVQIVWASPDQRDEPPVINDIDCMFMYGYGSQ